MLTLAPVLKRFFEKVLLPREGPLPVIVSLIAVLVVVEMLQALKCFATDPDDFAQAIKKHLDCFIEAYGKSVRTKTSLCAALAVNAAKIWFFIEYVRP
jgi:hypothetical protein